MPPRGEYGDDNDSVVVAVDDVGVVVTVEAVDDENVDDDAVLTAKFSSFENPAAESSPRGNGLAPGPIPRRTSSSEG